ncbi:MAG: IclR family transcriptional regulator [Alphaproteobacteria bacterium]|nr:IclR family transcriptional regulator [Alphaproteobacteria bacterium]
MAVKRKAAPKRATESRAERMGERPGAPALEKGLDLLEALAEDPGGLTQKALAVRLGRSVGEIFRMLGVLERRAYIARDAATGQYGLTLRLFELANRHPPMRRLQSAALPIMQDLARATGLACHLVMVNADRILVVAQAEPDRQMGWSVKLGAVFALSEHFASARVLAAFQPPARRAAMEAIMAAQPDAAPRAALTRRLDRIARAGYDMAPSEWANGITDISVPIIDHLGEAIAALTVPYLPQIRETVDKDEVLRLQRAAAQRISVAIGGGGK